MKMQVRRDDQIVWVDCDKVKENHDQVLTADENLNLKWVKIIETFKGENKNVIKNN